MNKLSKLCILGALSVLGLSACGGGAPTSSVAPESSAAPQSSQAPSSEQPSSLTPSSSEEPYVPSYDSDTLYVKKVENLPDDFYHGMDLSTLLTVENAGGKFYNFEGKQEDPIKIFADYGINLIRVRVWNDPFDAQGRGYGGGNCDINTALEIGKRATKYGVSLLVSFHYSDFWADPSRQNCPKAWVGMDIDQKCDALEQYTKESLQLLKDNNVDVAIVSIGNETNGYALAGETGINNFSALLRAGSKATREVLPEAQIAVHFTNPHSANFGNIVRDLSSHDVDYDIFGSSYYPYYHGTLEQCAANLKNAIRSSRKKAMIMETAYPFTDYDSDGFGNEYDSYHTEYPKNYAITVNGQAHNQRDVTDMMVNSTYEGYGIGVVYWEGAWLGLGGKESWESRQNLWGKYGCGWATTYASSYDIKAPTAEHGGSTEDNHAFFDENGHAIESLKVFKLMKEGNTDIDVKLDGVDSTSCEAMITGEITLPETVNGVYTSNERSPVPVVWENVDFDELRKQGPKSHIINGKVTVDKVTYDTTCTLTLNAFSYITNGSFEEGINPWKLVNLSDVKIAAGVLEIGVEKKDAVAGQYSFHTWGNDANSVKWEISQDINLFEDTTVNARAQIHGGVGTNIGDPACENIYVAVKVNGEEKYKSNVVSLIGWNNFCQMDIAGMELKVEDKNEIVVHVESSEANFWAALDDINVY